MVDYDKIATTAVHLVANFTSCGGESDSEGLIRGASTRLIVYIIDLHLYNLEPSTFKVGISNDRVILRYGLVSPSSLSMRELGSRAWTDGRQHKRISTSNNRSGVKNANPNIATCLKPGGAFAASNMVPRMTVTIEEMNKKMPKVEWWARAWRAVDFSRRTSFRIPDSP